jgi:hypothetical protein
MFSRLCVILVSCAALVAGACLCAAAAPAAQGTDAVAAVCSQCDTCPCANGCDGCGNETCPCQKSQWRHPVLHALVTPAPRTVNVKIESTVPAANGQSQGQTAAPGRGPGQAAFYVAMAVVCALSALVTAGVLFRAKVRAATA